MKFESFEHGRSVFGQVVYRQDPTVHDLHTVKVTTNGDKMFFMFRNKSYMLTLDEIINEVKQHHKKVSKTKKTK